VGGWRKPVSNGVCCKLHSHQGIEIVYHPTGRGHTRLKNADPVSFAEDSFIVYAPQLIHDQVMEKEGEDLCIQLMAPPDIPRLSGCLHIQGNNRQYYQDASLLTSGRVSPSPAEQTILNLRATTLLLSLVQSAFSEQSPSSHSGDPFVKAAEAYILDHFASIQSMEQVAQHTGISHDHLRHLFKKNRAMSLITFLNQTRIERAKSLLIHSRLSMKEISSLCGFRDEYYFSAVFARNLGLPPGAYRKAQGALP
jgi:AraC-like DNA-binding protein